jgi:phospholipid/cholesterol/gamma-HCH transport system substrate-binding protein
MLKEVKLGFFVVIALSVFLSLIFMLGNFSFGKYYSFSVYFSDVSGLSVKSPIKISGVEIGIVENLQLEKGEAKVIAKVKKDVVVYKNSRITIASTGVVGSKYLEITKGEGDTEIAGIVKDGDTLRGIAPYNMEKILSKVMNVFDGFTSKGDIEKSDIFKTIRNLEQITDKINKGLGKDQQDIRDIVINVREATKSINYVSGELQILMKNNKKEIQEDINKVGQIMTHLNSAGAKINQFLDKINNGEGTISTLVNDEKMAKELKDTIMSLKDVSNDIKGFTSKAKKIDVYWNTELDYNYQDSLQRTSAGIIIAPKPDKRYILRVNNFASDTLTNYDAGNQKYNSFTALIEKDFGKSTLHAGLIKSEGGIGAKYKITKNIGVGVDAYRFSRKNTAGSKVPWVDPYISYNLTKWAKVKVGYNDALEKSSVNASIDIAIKDEDISYLFGLAGLSKL